MDSSLFINFFTWVWSKFGKFTPSNHRSRKNKLYEIEYKSLDTVGFLGYFSFNLPEVKPIKTSDSTLLFKTDSFKIIVEEVNVDTNVYRYEFNQIKDEDQINGKKFMVLTGVNQKQDYLIL